MSLKVKVKSTSVVQVLEGVFQCESGSVRRRPTSNSRIAAAPSHSHSATFCSLLSDAVRCSFFSVHLLFQFAKFDYRLSPLLFCFSFSLFTNKFSAFYSALRLFSLHLFLLCTQALFSAFISTLHSALFSAFISTTIFTFWGYTILFFSLFYSTCFLLIINIIAFISEFDKFKIPASHFLLISNRFTSSNKSSKSSRIIFFA